MSLNNNKLWNNIHSKRNIPFIITRSWSPCSLENSSVVWTTLASVNESRVIDLMVYWSVQRWSWTMDMDVLGFIVSPYGLHFLASPPTPTHFEPVPAPSCNWWHTGAGRLMPRRKDNRHTTNHISNVGPTPRTASHNYSSLADGSGRLWFKHLHGWNTCTALQIHGMQQVSGVNVYYTLERETRGPEVNGACTACQSSTRMSNKYSTPIHYNI